MFKIKTIWGLCIVLILIQIIGCKGCNRKKINPLNIEDFDEEKLIENIKSELEILTNDTGYTHYYDTLKTFYTQAEYQPVWLEKIKDSVFNSKLNLLYDSIPFEGFKTKHYQVDEVKERLKNISKAKGEKLYKELAILELKLSNSLLSLWHDKVMGRSNPKDVLGAKYTLPYPSHAAFGLFSVLNLDTGFQQLSNYYPQHSDYWKLKKLLALEFNQTQGTETFIDTTGIRKLKPKDSTYIIPLLARRLVELALAPDSILAKYDTSFIYTNELATYITQFQKTSNVTDDGIIGKSTLKLLNASKNDKINEIRVNIERIRWFGYEPPKPFVMVNIPELMLYMYYIDSVKSMPVCIGSGKERNFEQKLIKYAKSKNYLDKPQTHETPQVFSNIDYAILNPTWTVPSSIVGREMLGRIQKDPGYLVRGGFKVFLKNEEVNPYNVNWKKYAPNNLPYTIRQDAGDENALGKIKFTFKNPFSVYLHDTPLKSKFKLNNRAVSHGCVRVQSPVDLTGFVLQQNTKITYDDALIKMGLPPTDTARARKWREDTTSYKKIVKGTYPIKLENKMTVFFDYKTIVFDELGNPRFIFDVYDKNKAIAEAMDKN